MSRRTPIGGWSRWSWLVLTAVGLATAIIFLVWPAPPVLPGAALLLAMCAGLLHLRAARRATDLGLHAREALIRIVVDGAIDAIITVDSLGAVASFNPAAERMFGWPPAEIVGQNVSLLFLPERANPVRAGEREVLATHRDGSPFPVHMTCSESRLHGQVVVTVIARDLTQYRQNAEALQVANALLEIKVVELEERTRAITLLGQMSDRLQSAVNPAEAYASIGDYARQLFPMDAGALCAADPMKERVEVVASWGWPATRSVFPPGDCWALRRGRAHAVSGGDAATPCPHVSNIPAAGDACLPIISQGESLGIVHFRWHPRNTETGDAATVAALFRTKLATAFVEQVSLALTNLRLKEMLRDQATHDPLTGLHNRRFLEEALHRELLRAARKGSPVGVLMLDLDDFKAFNDAHGHAAGDALLRAFAVQLRSDIRAEDIACRYGGEEFTVILPDATAGQAMTRAEQIRAGMHKIVVDFQGRRLAGVTVSIGVAALPEHGMSPDALLRAADAALYAAKADGRDRSKCAARMLESVRAQPRFSSARRSGKETSAMPTPRSEMPYGSTSWSPWINPPQE